ncbi:flagellar biosynthetic protein FliO [Paraclostridium sordellii]|uniref:flagellar biosynthetic protein FliO n=1 Tax=Paraclostridium sordellii TaxID=1505 RepID=UPI0018993C80|nr:flagellar biosynthetic protein FliO [Paeniclostridium sordellii]
MDGMLQYLVNLSAFVILMFLIILIAHKINGVNLQNMGIYKYAKVIEKVSISKDTFLIILKTGDEGCVLLISPNNVERIRDLNKADLEEIENSKKSNHKLRPDASKFTKVKFNKFRFKKSMYNTMDVINKLEEKEDANIK